MLIRMPPLALLCLGLVACGVPQSEFDKLRAENQQLKAQVDELLDGEAHLSAETDKVAADKNYALTKAEIEQSPAKHPESAKNAQYKPLYEDAQHDGFNFDDTGDIVVARGTRWFPLVPTDAASWGPGAEVHCLRKRSICTVRQFYDGGATNIVTTYRVTYWDDRRIAGPAGEFTLPGI